MGLLQDKICIVTGAGQGIGRAIAREAAREGATVLLLDRNGEAAHSVAREIAEAGGRAEAQALDVTDHERLRSAVEDAITRHGRIDALVNNAAINPPTFSILEDTLENWRRTIGVNLEAVFVGSKLVAPHMARQRAGRIVHIASVQGFVASGGIGSYNAAKGALIALTKSMAVELAPFDVLVNAVAPGFVSTPMALVDGVDEADTPDWQEWYGRRRKVPLGRSGQPEDVAGTVVFLLSPLCRYMTGQVLVVDGGMTSTF